ncbi:hypothetical protein ASC77_19560 [Nocardioides sp. Root1257]|uniref:SDR family NAD(P)-dependent oxidoreductase n=1 Tax=unclassified Nocardioides TaxID=2615069 RepID=UPI0006F21E63|nr:MULTISPECIES: SDR family NAD(P)-dependent oxidoreductase [unclassified Nocardioides]KQW44987.1 hypothetical protein ASC77_19560 [Nocardioides sp. Root1257]KRC46009.1 hypothetical protein ASE24_15660 [Nocardioides sp. Root224]
MTFDLTGHVVVITGAGSGMGAAHARGLSRRGADVVINDLPGVGEKRAAEVAEGVVAAGGRAEVIACDVSDPTSAQQLIDLTLDRFGGIDVLVNNASILRDGDIPDLSTADWRAVLGVNLDAAFYLTRACWPRMAEQGAGSLIHIGSASGLFGNVGQLNYSASKMGLAGLSRAAAVEGAPFGIRSNLIAPMSATPMSRSANQSEGSEPAPRRSSRVPAREILGHELFDSYAPEDVTTLVAVLAHRTSTISGHYFTSAGGRVSEVVVAETDGYGFSGLSDEALATALEPRVVVPGLSIHTGMLGHLEALRGASRL